MGSRLEDKEKRRGVEAEEGSLCLLSSFELDLAFAECIQESSRDLTVFQASVKSLDRSLIAHHVLGEVRHTASRANGNIVRSLDRHTPSELEEPASSFIIVGACLKDLKGERF